MDAENERVVVRKAQLIIPIQFLRKAISYTEAAPNITYKWTAYLSSSDSQPAATNVETSKVNGHLNLTFAQLHFRVTDGFHRIHLEKITLENPDTAIYQTHEKQTQTDASDRSGPDMHAEAVGQSKATTGDAHGNHELQIEDLPKPVKRKRGRPCKKEKVQDKTVEGVGAGVMKKETIETKEKIETSLPDATHLQEGPRKYSLRGVKLNSDIMAAEKGYTTEDRAKDMKDTEASIQESASFDSALLGKTNNENISAIVNEPPEAQSVDHNGSVREELNQTHSEVDSRKIVVDLEIKTDRLRVDKKRTKKRSHNKIFLGNVPKFQRRKRPARHIFCKICKKRLSDYTGVFEHVKKHHKASANISQYLSELEKLMVEQCSECGEVFADRHKMQVHEDREHIKNVAVDCYLCGKTFKNVQSLRNHVRWIHQQAGVRHGLCHLCPATFKSTTTLKHHIDEIHYGNKYFQCDTCKKKFYNKSQLKRHSRIHGLDESKRKYCSQCSKSFLFEFNLKRHVEAVHNPQSERYHCSYCGKGFGQKTGMIAHVQLVHFNLLPFSCKLCKSAFARSTLLTEHMLIVHKQPNFKVTNAMPKFSIYNKTEDDLHYCSYCNEGFSHKTRLVEHMHMSHADAFPYICQTCKQGFLEISFLNVHRLKAHGIFDQTEVNEHANTKRNDILQVISGKSGKVGQSGEGEVAGNITDDGFQDSQPPAVTTVIDARQSEVKPTAASTSSLVIEVADGTSSYNYVIEAEGTLGEDGSISVAQDIAQLLLAAEQTIQQDGTKTDNSQDKPVKEISLLMDENNQLIVHYDALENQEGAMVPLDTAPTVLDQENREETLHIEDTNTSNQMEMVQENYFSVRTTQDEGESHDVDLLQLAATETVASYDGGEDMEVDSQM